jgi:gas vesicle protein
MSFIPQISHIAVSDTKIQVVGGIVGILLGAFVGSLATYWIGEKARKKQKETDEIKEQRKKVRTHEKAVKNANAEIEGLLVLILKNIEHYKDIQQGIISPQGQFRTTISMPQPYPHQTGIGVDLLNVSLAVKWQSFESEVVLQNSNLNEFNEYYVALRSSAHEALLHSANLNRQVLDRDNTAIKDGAAQCILASESFKERCFVLLAEIELGAKRWKSFDFTTITLQELKDYMEKIGSFKPTDKQLTKHISKEFRLVYTPENAFKLASQQVEVADTTS